MGANGNRPLLSAFEARSAAVSAGEPSFRVPGSSRAAPPAWAAGVGPGGEALSRPGPANRPPATNLDIVNEQQGAPRGSGDGASTLGASMHEDGEKGAAAAMPRRGRWADSCPPCDRVARNDDDSDYAVEDAYVEEDGGDDDDDGGWTWKLSPEDLRRRWLQECRAVRTLEHVERNCAEPSAALLAAREARDRAEQEWKESRDPKPVAIRLGYAQKKLEKAQRSLDRQKDILAEFEEATERRRAELQAKVDEAECRLRERQSQMDQLHREAGDLAAEHPEGRGGGIGDGEAERIVGVMAKELQAFIESLEEGSQAREKANVLLAKVATASSRSDVRHFDIGTDQEEEGDGTETWRAPATGPGDTGDRRGPTWSEHRHGKWNKSLQSEGSSKEAQLQDVRIGTASSSTTNAVEAGPSRVRAPTRGRDEQEQQQPNKFHRGQDMEVEASVETSCDDAARAAKLHKEQQAAIDAAREANATFGDETSMHIAGQLYAHKVELVRARAQAIGIVPTCEGKQLIELQPDDLNRWVREVLAPAESKKKENDDADY